MDFLVVGVDSLCLKQAGRGRSTLVATSASKHRPDTVRLSRLISFLSTGIPFVHDVTSSFYSKANLRNYARSGKSPFANSTVLAVGSRPSVVEGSVFNP